MATYTHTIAVTDRQLGIVAGALALAYADERSWRDHARKVAKKPGRSATFAQSAETSQRNMAEIEAIVGSLDAIAQAGFASELAEAHRRLAKR